MTKINKKQARKLYENGDDFTIVARNLRPDLFGVKINCCSFERLADIEFDIFINEFTYYNCDGYRGRYPAFYIEQGGCPTFKLLDVIRLIVPLPNYKQFFIIVYNLFIDFLVII